MGLDEKNLGLRLLRAESAGEVRDIINGDKTMSAPANWLPLGGRDTNSNVITNQATNGGKAATELITNMVDAMLTKRCLEEGIDPKGDNAPKSMYEAVDKFIQPLSGGRIINATREWRRTYARQNLTIGITANDRKNAPCYTFADNGEGQHPANFPNTFLSLSERHKRDIPFVQGKYNMGSSGVLNFCEDWLKLIISRRYDREGEWGWTLIREHATKSGMSYAEYFAPDNEIQTIGRGKIQPFRSKSGEFGDVVLESGTIVKLYNFYVGKSHASFKGAREAFNENLVETILPFRIYDFRWRPDVGRGGLRAQGIDDRAFYGMEYQLVESQGEETGDTPDAESGATPIGTITIPQLGKITITAVILKKDISEWYRNSSNRIFHHVNGQVHFKEMRGVLTQCRLPALKDRVAIFVDASELTDGAHNKIWKADRENIHETLAGRQYKDAVRNAIRDSRKLKELNHRITREELDSASTDSARDLVVKLIERDRNLAALLSGAVPDVPAPSGKKPKEKLKDLKYNPSYLEVRQSGQDGIVEITLPINKSRPVPCTTDVTDDYFTRAQNRGDIIFDNDETADKFSFLHTLENGELVVYLKPNKQKLEVGDTEDVRFGLQDDGMPQPVYADKTLRISLVAAVARESKPATASPPRQAAAGLPKYKLVTRDGREINDQETGQWGDPNIGAENFDDKSGGYVRNFGDESLYLINYDNVFFQSYLRSQKTEARQSEVSKKYILAMRILMLGLERVIEDAEKKDEGMDADKFRRIATQGVASVALSVCDQLPESFRLFADDDGGDE